MEAFKYVATATKCICSNQSSKAPCYNQVQIIGQWQLERMFDKIKAMACVQMRSKRDNVFGVSTHCFSF
jgi:hypothetical protein